MSLPPRRKPTSKPSSTSKKKGSELDERQRELLAQQSKLEEEIKALQRTITEAPKRADEEKRRAQEAARAAYKAAAPSRNPQFRHSATVADKRFVDEPVTKRSKSRPLLRAERRQAQLQTLALLVVLVAAIFWALHYLYLLR